MVLAITLGRICGHPEAWSVACFEPLIVNRVDGRLAKLEAVPAALVHDQEEGTTAGWHARILEIIWSLYSVSGKIIGYPQ